MVVKVSRSYYKRGKTYCCSINITPMRSLSNGEFNFDDEISQSDVESTLDLIENLHDVEDGYYQVIYTNISRDFESGYIDDYNLKLIPYEKETK